MSEKYVSEPLTQRPMFDRKFRIKRKRYHIFIDACIKSNIWEYNIDDLRCFMLLPPDATFRDRVDIATALLGKEAQREWHEVHESGNRYFRCTEREWSRYKDTHFGRAVEGPSPEVV